jgi:hypothetical protein
MLDVEDGHASDAVDVADRVVEVGAEGAAHGISVLAVAQLDGEVDDCIRAKSACLHSPERLFGCAGGGRL